MLHKKKKKLNFTHIDVTDPFSALGIKSINNNFKEKPEILKRNKWFKKDELSKNTKKNYPDSFSTFSQDRSGKNTQVKSNFFSLKYSLKILQKFLFHFLNIIGISSLAAIITILTIFWKYGRELPDYYFLKSYHPPSITRIYDRFGIKIKEYAKEKRVYVHLSDIPPKLIHAFLAAEDKNFYNHKGIYFPGILRAIIRNTQQKKWKEKPLGASTITQQVAKVFLVGNEPSITRKIKEAILSFRLENALTKDRIIELYMNQIYLGRGNYGVIAAAKGYFEKTLHELTLSECAFIAALPKSPNHYDPFKNPQRAIARRNWVLQRMNINKIISNEDYEKAIQEPLQVYKTTEQYPLEYSYFLEEARKELIKLFGEKTIYLAGIEATLTLHPHMQNILDKALKSTLTKYDKRHGWRGPIGKIDLKNWIKELSKFSIPANLKATPCVILAIEPEVKIGFKEGKIEYLYENKFSKSNKFQKISVGDVVLVKKTQGVYKLFQIPKITGGAVVLDASNGEVLALSGGYSFDLSQFNCSTQAMRQPGSAFKPFVYLTAFENGMEPNSLVNEKPVNFGGYTPTNYNKSVYGGNIPLYFALTHSRNVATVILADKLGINNVIDTAARLGLSDYMPHNLTVALGAAETTVLKMAAAYAPFFNKGYRIKPRLFLNIASPFYKNLESSQGKNKEKVISKKNASYMKKMLEGVISEGTAKNIAYLKQELPINLYGKTGTSNDFKDAWFVGCVELKKEASEKNTILKHKHPLIFAVFIGYPHPKSLGNNENSTKVAAPFAEKLIKQFFNFIEE